MHLLDNCFHLIKDNGSGFTLFIAENKSLIYRLKRFGLRGASLSQPFVTREEVGAIIINFNCTF